MMRGLIIAVLIIQLVAGQVCAATYYVRAGGTAANKAAATGPSNNAAACMSITTHNTQTYAADDIIIVSDAGGTHTDQRLIPPSSGTAGHPIVYQNEGTPIIAVSTSQQLDVNGRSYLTITGLTFQGGTYANAYFQGTDNGIIISNCTFGISGNAAGAVRNLVFSAGTGLQIISSRFYQGSNIGLYLIAGTATLTGNTFTGVAGQTYSSALRFDSGVTLLSLNNNTVNGWSLSAATSPLVYFNGCSGVTSSGNTIGSLTSPNMGYGYYALNVTGFNTTGDVIQYQPYASYWSGVTGLVANNTIMRGSTASSGHGWEITGTTGTMTGCAAQNNTGRGFSFSGASNITGANLTAQTNGQSSGMDGFWTQDSAQFICTGCTSLDNYKDGYSANNTSSMTLSKCTSANNGQRDNTDNTGNGFTGHQTATVNITNALAYNNTKSCIGYIDGTSGSLQNSTCVNNYRANAYTHYGEIYLNSTGAWTVRNNIATGPGNVVFLQSNSTGTKTFDHNLYYPTGVANAWVWTDAANVDFTAWQTHSVDTVGSSVTNPLFVSATDYHLQTSSPAIGAGVNITGIHDQATPSTDADGLINHVQPVNIGAYDGRPGVTITADYAPTGLTLRGTPASPAVISVQGIGLLVNLSDLTNDEPIQVKVSGSNSLRQFTPRGTLQTILGSGASGGAFLW